MLMIYEKDIVVDAVAENDDRPHLGIGASCPLPSGWLSQPRAASDRNDRIGKTEREMIKAKAAYWQEEFAISCN